MNFLQIGLISFLRVALNIMTCFVRGVHLKMFCTSFRMSARGGTRGSVMLANRFVEN